MPRNILIFHVGALGDFVLTWPLGLALGRLYPQSRIIYITHQRKGELAEKLLHLESMDIESGWHHLFGDVSRLPQSCRGKLESAHSVFTYINRPGDAWAQAVATVAPNAKIVPMNHQLLDSLSAYPAICGAVSQILASIAGNGIRYPMHNEFGPIALHPGSGSSAKCWPAESYLRLIDLLRAANRQCQIILGEVERERWPADQIRRFESAAPTAHPATYVELLEELSRCSAFVGNDSGPGQLAGIIGLPSVILFGPTDPSVWKPLGPRVTAVRAEPISNIAPSEIAAAIVSGSHQLCPV